MLTQLKIAGILGAIAAVAIWYEVQLHQARKDGKAECVAAQTAAALVATEAARTRESQWQQDAKTIDEVRAHERIQADTALSAALAGLRNRPSSRLPETATCTADGAGATGRQLSEPDGAFLTRFTAAAEVVSADLRVCQGYLNVIEPGPAGGGLRQR